MTSETEIKKIKEHLSQKSTSIMSYIYTIRHELFTTIIISIDIIKKTNISLLSESNGNIR